MLSNMGLSITLANGKPVIGKDNSNPIVAHVNLVEASAIPSLKGQFLKVQADCPLPESQVLFSI